MAAAAVDLNQAFRTELDDFRTRAGLKAGDCQFSSLTDVLATVNKIQKEDERTKTERYIRRLEPFIRTMDEFGKVVDVFLNASEFVAFVWGPLKFLLLTTAAFADAFNSLLDVYQEIGEQIPLLVKYNELFHENKHLQNVLVLIYRDILEFHVLAVRYFKQSVWKKLFKANWKGFSSNIKLIKENLRRNKRLIEGTASLDEFEKQMRFRKEADEKFKEDKKSQEDSRRVTVQDWLMGAEAQETYEEHVEIRSSNPGSGRWILQKEGIQTWLNPKFCSNPIFWINGKPGAGKSVLTSLIIEEALKIQEQEKANDPISVAYFFCSHSHAHEKNKFVFLAKSLLSQLLAQDEAENLLVYFEEERKASHGGSGPLKKEKLAKELLKTVLKRRKTYLILDGIDEYPREDRKNICEWFRSLDITLGLAHGKRDEIRCLFVSQDDGIAKKDLVDVPALTITAANNREDIECFARLKQKEIEKKHKFLLKEQGLPLADLVTARAQGVFIYARCVMDELANEPSPAAILREWSAGNLPEDLNDLYMRIYDRIMGRNGRQRPSESQRQTVKTLLSWVSFSKRPMKWHEIQGVISIDKEMEANWELSRLTGSANDFCGSFVVMHADQTVQLVHKTVKDFLLLQDDFRASEVELDLCCRSVEYLKMLPPCEETSTEELLTGRYSFYDYAAPFWSFHLVAWLTSYATDQAPDQNSINRVQEELEPFLQIYLGSNIAGMRKPVSDTMKKPLRRLESFKYYAALEEAVVWSRKQTMAGADDDESDFLSLPELTQTIRSVLESYVERGLTPEQDATLQKYYGECDGDGYWFKCRRVSCYFFHRGFRSRHERDAHDQRHDKSYTCHVDGCPQATLGLGSKADLDKHLLDYHGERDEAALVFIEVADPNKKPKKEHELKNACTSCPRRFRYKYNLRVHEQHHTGIKLHICKQLDCGKAFARQHDLNHHAHLHSDEQFVCEGWLKADKTKKWGCGRAFNQPNSLRRHFRSKKGTACLKPIYEEMTALRGSEMKEFDGAPKVSVQDAGLQIGLRGVKDTYPMTRGKATTLATRAGAAGRRPGRKPTSPAAPVSSGLASSSGSSAEPEELEMVEVSDDDDGRPIPTPSLSQASTSYGVGGLGGSGYGTWEEPMFVDDDDGDDAMVTD